MIEYDIIWIMGIFVSSVISFIGGYLFKEAKDMLKEEDEERNSNDMPKDN